MTDPTKKILQVCTWLQLALAEGHLSDRQEHALNESLSQLAEVVDSLETPSEKQSREANERYWKED